MHIVPGCLHVISPFVSLLCLCPSHWFTESWYIGHFSRPFSLRSFSLSLPLKDVFFPLLTVSPNRLLCLTTELWLPPLLGHQAGVMRETQAHTSFLFCCLMLTVVLQLTTLLLALTQNFVSLSLLCSLLALVSPSDDWILFYWDPGVF